VRVADGLSMTLRDGRWVARYRTLELAWSVKRLPDTFGPREEDKARRWIVAWYEQYLRDGGVQPITSQVRPSTRVTIADVYDRWMAYRRDDAGTDPSYARALTSQYQTWIGSHEIAQLDIATELGPLPIVQWIRSLRGAASSRLTVASTLSVLITDVILHGKVWGVDPSMPHPMLASPHIVRELDVLRGKKRNERVTPIFSPEEIDGLLTKRSSKVLDGRRVKYLVALSTGMRERELQGLVWSDLKSLPVPHVWIHRQLVTGGSAPFVWQADARRDPESVKGRAVCKPPKRDSRRAIPLSPLVVEVLTWWRSTGWQQHAFRQPLDQDPVFPSGFRNRHRAHGEFCTPTPGSMLLDDLDRLGIARSYTSPHNGLTADHTSRSFRHTFASLLSQVGIDDGRIGDLLGHSASSVTRTHYIETLLSARAEVVSKLKLPDRVTMRTVEIVDPTAIPQKGGKVVELRR
jgi:integrase